MTKKTISKKESNDSTQSMDYNQLVLYSISGFFAIIILQLIAYFGFLKNISNFLPSFGLWIFYLDISIVTIGIALWYIASYSGYKSCMASMMIGMTMGMQIGMMIGAVYGAVNGFFIGAMIGMIAGSLIGAITGKTHTMGWLQGLMSGVMGGTMGAMITLMMFTDRIIYFMPFYMILNIAIIIGFLKMYHEEVIKDNADVVINDIGILTFTSLCVIAGFVFTAILVYAPKSILFGG